MNRYTVTKSPLTPVGNTPAIPKPWNLYNETACALVSCHATRGEAIVAAGIQEQLDEEKALAERVEFARTVAQVGGLLL